MPLDTDLLKVLGDELCVARVQAAPRLRVVVRTAAAFVRIEPVHPRGSCLEALEKSGGKPDVELFHHGERTAVADAGNGSKHAPDLRGPSDRTAEVWPLSGP